MRYQTTDFMRDTYPFFDLLYFLNSRIKSKMTSFLKNVIDFEYDEFIFRIADNLFLGFLIIYLGIIFTFTLGKYLERPYGTKISTITTNSMSPSIIPGSIVITVPSNSYKVGDIINYKEILPSTGFETGRAITHRIIEQIEKEGKTYFVAKGDSNNQPDFSLIKNTDISGKVVYIIPYLGYFEIMIKTLPGFLIFIVMPSLLLLINEVKYIKNYLRKFRS